MAQEISTRKRKRPLPSDDQLVSRGRIQGNKPLGTWLFGMVILTTLPSSLSGVNAFQSLPKSNHNTIPTKTNPETHWNPFLRIRQSKLFASSPLWNNNHNSLHNRQRISSPTHTAGFSGLFTSRTRTTSASTATQLNMVLTTPESIIEQASTVKLLDDLIDESVRTSARRPIMRQFDPSSGWIWKRWRGTIFSETWDSCISKMAYAMICMVFFHRILSPVRAQAAQSLLQGFDVLWGQMLQVTTFTLTFFLNQSYQLWRKCYALSRRLQGRLHDINMSLAAHATRKPPSTPGEGAGSTCTAASRQVLELISRYARLFNLLTYASFTRSHRPILTPRGMRRLVERGLLTPAEREVLVNVELPATQRHNVILLWIARTFLEAWRAGHFEGGAGFENQILDKIHVCRAQYGAIGDELSGRMPLAYAHIVQVLVDVVLWMYPLMAVASGKLSPVLAVLGTGILTISYQGLFDLAKQFLDPYDNESFGKGEDPLVVDTLIAETNAGSVRWLSGMAEFPIAPQHIQEGELSDYLLPVRGISVDELEQMKLEQQERERELQERREKEEEERRLSEERARALQRAADAMIPALWQENDGEFYQELEKYPTSFVMVNADESRVNGQHHPDATLELTDEEFLDAGSSLADNDENSAPVVNGDSTLDEGSECNFNLDEQDDRFSLDAGFGVADICNRLDDIAGGVPLSLIPDGTAAAKQERLSKKPFSEDKNEKDGATPPLESTENDQAGDEEETKTPSSVEQVEWPEEIAEFDDSSTAEIAANGDETTAIVNETVVDEEEAEAWEEDDYVHTFDFGSVESAYKDLPWFDQVDADGKEIRLSQILAEEEWEEEIEAAREKEEAAAASNAVRTFEDYTRRISEIRDATNSELAETQEILEAAPGAESTSLSSPGDSLTAAADLKPVYYDQTKLDGISQLWGLPPGEISEEFGYQDSSLDVDDEDASFDSFDGLMQLSGQGYLPSSFQDAQNPSDSSRSPTFSISSAWRDAYNTDMEEEDDFGGLGTLWGIGSSSLDEDWPDLSLQEEEEDSLSSSATRIVKRQQQDLQPQRSVSWISPPSTAKTPSPTLEIAGGSQSMRLSQILADEVWEEEIVPPEPEEVVNPVTLEDYNKQVAEIIEAENEELLETEAILNAPSFAESLEGFGDDNSSKLKAVNDTKAVKDDLSALEMDVEDDDIVKKMDVTDTYLSSLSSDSVADGEAATTTKDESPDAPTPTGEVEPPIGSDSTNGQSAKSDPPSDNIPPDMNIIL